MNAAYEHAAGRRRDGQANRLGSGREQQPVVGNPASVREHDLAGTGVDAGCIRLETQVDLVLRIEAFSAQRNPVLRRLAGEVVLGKIGPIDGWRFVVAEHDDAALISFAAQFLGRGKTGRAAADDNDFIGRPGGVFITRLRCHPFAFLAYENLAIPLFHRPARERTEGGSAQGFACAQIETSVMPWTTDGVIDHQTIGQRPAVMRACRADCEHLVPAAHQQHLLVAAMTDELAAIGEIEQARCL